MNEQTQTRIDKIKSNIKAHAKPILAGVASVTAVLYLREQTKNTRVLVAHAKADYDQRVYHGDIVQQAIAQGREFDVYPGVGVYVHPTSDNSTAVEE